MRPLPRPAAATLALAALLSAASAPSRAEEAGASLEYAVKAAFLLNFAKFVEWPADSPQARSEAVIIGILGRDPFGPLLHQTIDGRTAGGRPIRLKRYPTLADLEPCHILFIADADKERLPPIFERLNGQPVLTVGESKAFTRRGGVIGLLVEDNRARFEVNLRVARELGLTLSSRLLAVAKNLAPHAAGR
jgi:hypothetical protein